MFNSNGNSETKEYKAVAFIDPYWLIGRAELPTAFSIDGIQRALGQRVRVERFYWYIETESVAEVSSYPPRVSMRVVARDDLDDGFELIRAIDADLRANVQSKIFDVIVIASHDDRLALTLEWAKTHCPRVIGCAAPAEEPDPRIQRIVDELIEPRLGHMGKEENGSPPPVEVLAVIDSTIDQWKAEAEAEEVSKARVFIKQRPGLPRPIDSRLLFLGRTKLGRDLTQGERITLRRRFRDAMQTETVDHLTRHD